MALVNGGFLRYMDMKKFIKNFLLRNRWSDFEIISQECSLDDPFQYCSRKFDSSLNMALGNGAFFHRASKIFGPLSSIRVFIADTGIFEI